MKRKYLAGAAIISMFFTMQPSFAAEDGIIVYDFTEKTDTPQDIGNQQSNKDTYNAYKDADNNSEIAAEMVNNADRTMEVTKKTSDSIKNNINNTIDDINPDSDIDPTNDDYDVGDYLNFNDSNNDYDNDSDKNNIENNQDTVDVFSVNDNINDIPNNINDNFNYDTNDNGDNNEDMSFYGINDDNPVNNDDTSNNNNFNVNNNYGDNDDFNTIFNDSSNTTTFDDNANDKDYTENINKNNINNINNINDKQEAYEGRRYIKKNDKTNNDTNENGKKYKKKKARFVKIVSDDSYIYYLDRDSVRWINRPYSNSEYMADVWIRMINKYNNSDADIPQDLYDYINSDDTDDEIADAKAKGILYDETDVKVLRTKKYFLEHYYIRPKTQQIQFLCELEVVDRPQNTISERAYDYKNWENLIPGSIEYAIYHGVLANINKKGSSERGHMKFVDKLEEYARISMR